MSIIVRQLSRWSISIDRPHIKLRTGPASALLLRPRILHHKAITSLNVLQRIQDLASPRRLTKAVPASRFPCEVAHSQDDTERIQARQLCQALARTSPDTLVEADMSEVAAAIQAKMNDLKRHMANDG